MKTNQKLNRNEMKQILGGKVPPGDCPASECTSDSDCGSTYGTKYPKCYTSTCAATGKAANYCGYAS